MSFYQKVSRFGALFICTYSQANYRPYLIEKCLELEQAAKKHEKMSVDSTFCLANDSSTRPYIFFTDSCLGWVFVAAASADVDSRCRSFHFSFVSISGSFLSRLVFIIFHFKCGIFVCIIRPRSSAKISQILDTFSPDDLIAKPQAVNSRQKFEPNHQNCDIVNVSRIINDHFIS